jgi:hypothetical protein
MELKLPETSTGGFGCFAHTDAGRDLNPSLISPGRSERDIQVLELRGEEDMLTRNTTFRF